MDETPPEEGDLPDLQTASIDKSKLPLILESKNNNNSAYIVKGGNTLSEVSKKLEDLLKD